MTTILSKSNKIGAFYFNLVIYNCSWDDRRTQSRYALPNLYRACE